MTILSDTVLVESRSARDDHLGNMPHERAQSILEKIKRLYFALWKGVGTATTQQMVEFYETPVDTVRSAFNRHKDEFVSDGVREITGKELKALRGQDHGIVQLPEATTRLVVWIPRSALRLGMVLKNSTVAKAVRTSLLDGVEKVIPAQAEEIERLRLQLALSQSQERLMAASQILGSINPDLPLLILRPDVTVIERQVPVATTVLVDERNRAIAQYDGVGISHLAQRYGFGKGKRANDACRAWLHSVGVSESQWVEEPTAHITRKLPRHILSWLDQQFAAKQGNRQRLLGE